MKDNIRLFKLIICIGGIIYMGGISMTEKKNHMGKNKDEDRFKIIEKKIDQLSLSMEKSKIIDYVNYLENPRKLLFANFISGVARGFGIAVGFSVLGAIGIYLLQRIVMLNLPLIGDFITDIVDIVQNNLNRSGGRVGI
jgi:hypothetical protein